MGYDFLKSFDEIMEVEKIVDVVHAETKKKYRLEVFKHVHGTAAVHYGVNYYERSSIGTWAEYHNFPWIKQDTVDEALHQALSFVNDRPQAGQVS